MKKYEKRFAELTGEMLNMFSEQVKDENIVFSPVSILLLMAIAAESTAGTTKDEIIRALCGKISYRDVREELNKLRIALVREGYLSCANAVVLNDSIKDSINPAFRDNLRESLGGELIVSDDVVGASNRWVKKKTRGMIDRIMDDNMADTLLNLINAVSFEARWLDDYTARDVKHRVFTNDDGSKSVVNMLHSDENKYVEDKQFTGVVKDYAGLEYSYMALLPKGKQVPSLDKIDFTGMFRNCSSERVITQIPEYEIRMSRQLTDAFAQMGIKQLFSDEADFSTVSSAWIKAENVIHKAYIKVDRSGTKAAAVTSMECFAGCSGMFTPLPKHVILNRPFVYCIIHNETGIPAFVGMVKNLNSVATYSSEEIERMDSDNQYDEEAESAKYKEFLEMFFCK